MSDEYELHRQRQLQEARDAFNGFMGGLTPKQRERLGNFSKPVDDTEMVNGHTVDMAETPAASYMVDVASEADSFAETLAETLDLEPEKAALLAKWLDGEGERRGIIKLAMELNRIAAVFIDSKNPKLMAGGLAFAAGLHIANELGTQADYARRMGLSRQALSKVTKSWQEALKLPPSPHMKSTMACRRYREKAREDHWRRRKMDTGERSWRLLQKLNEKYAI